MDDDHLAFRAPGALYFSLSDSREEEEEGELCGRHGDGEKVELGGDQKEDDERDMVSPWCLLLSGGLTSSKTKPHWTGTLGHDGSHSLGEWDD